jgi:2-C-methyl-D-erythritol 2,4-cyclodiphosphate synthase
MLGAICLGDIGQHFPDTSEEYRNIDSKKLLRKTIELVWEKGYRVVNLDSTICLERPKVRPYINQMQLVIASILHVGLDDVSIKATTTEQMGFVGRQEGVMAYATVLLQKNLEK